jgi:hypothetical protein
MGTVLYEAHYQFDPSNLTPILMLAFIILFPKIQEKILICQGKELTKTAKRIVRIFCIFCSIFIGSVTLVMITGEISMYNNVVKAYQRGEYETVEGYVKNFEPMPYAGHAKESFEINGVSFSYSDYEIQQGYHNAKSHGGVIKGDGQYLKIGYIQEDSNSKARNIIVYIEEPSESKTDVVSNNAQPLV